MKKIIILITIITSLYSNDCKFYYKVGSIDKHYDLTKYSLKQILKEIEYEWESKLGIDFLEYDDDNENSTPINIVYKKEFEKYNSLEENINKHKEMGLKLQNKYNIIKEQGSYLKNKDSKLNEEINFFNNNAKKYSQYEYKKRKSDLEYKINFLNNEYYELHKIIDEYNNEIDMYNKYYKNIENFKKESNLENHESRGVTFLSKETNYTKNIFGQIIDKKERIFATKIDIYRITSLNEFKIVLAHEIGHMVGFNHINDSGSLMNPIIQENQKNKFDITKADIILGSNTLRKMCY